MKKIGPLLVLLLLCSGHDMFLKLDTYLLPPNKDASIELFNGTFESSDNTIDRDRMVDVSLVGNGNRIVVDTSQWREKDGITILDFKTGEAGTWLAGVSTRARNIEMNAEDFNKYLEHDGVLDMLAWRKENNALDQAAVEKYSKHVKTVFQVGDKKTNDWYHILGYPIEFVPLNNPYEMHIDDVLTVELLWKGEPLVNQLVYVGSDGGHHDHDHDHEHEEGHSHDHDHEHDDDEDHHHHGDEVQQLRTNENGVIAFKVTDGGRWFLRTIHLTTSDEPGLTHESNWATLTFQVGHDHTQDSHDHDHAHGDHSHSHDDGHHHHDHSHEETGGLPSYVYWIGSLLLIAGLFFYFNQQKDSDLE
ncbi:MAG: DUF4198 domain-containing protein [Saprospiraceae bacterium]|nr:DUF4198 domain-containing protein [Saprospiraceae bacterium]